MKAKFVNEAIGEVLKPKSSQEITNSIEINRRPDFMNYIKYALTKNDAKLVYDIIEHPQTQRFNLIGDLFSIMRDNNISSVIKALLAVKYAKMFEVLYWQSINFEPNLVKTKENLKKHEEILTELRSYIKKIPEFKKIVEEHGFKIYPKEYKPSVLRAMKKSI